MNKQMKRTLFMALAMLSTAVLSNANPITKGQALNIASKYINNPTLSKNTPVTRSAQANEQPAYYIFTSSNDKKFVIISGESKLKMKKEEILKKYGEEIRKLDSEGSSLYLDISLYPQFTIEGLRELEEYNVSRQFFNLKFVPEHDIYTPKNTMIYKKPRNANRDFPYYILWLDPIEVLETLGKNDEAYNISESGYTQGCYDLSIGESRIISVSFVNGKFKLIDGRHRILTFLAHCKYRELPCYLPKEDGGPSFEEKFKHLLKTPDDVKIFINDKNEYCIEIPTKLNER